MKDKEKTKASDPVGPVSVDILISDRTGNFDNVGSINPYGLTKREYFAAMAMQGILANSHRISDHVSVNAVNAVHSADALIEILNTSSEY